MELLDVSRVTRRFRGIKAIDDVSFSMEAGEVVGLIGPNGAGKTTLFNMIAGALVPDSGTIRFAGTNITGKPAYAITKLGISRTFQIPQPFHRLTVLENILVGAMSRTSNRAQALETAMAVARRVRLDDRVLYPATALTTSMRKMLELARALATGPKLLLLDEVFAGMTPAEVDMTVPLLREIASDGTAILMVEHVLRAVVSVCGRMVVLNQGALIAQGTPAEIAANPAVIEAYLGSEVHAHA